jgi:hypothetical protein
MLDQVAEFAQQMPAWTGKDGFPLTYKHFIYGMKWIKRSYARQNLRMLGAVQAHIATKEEYRDYVNEQNANAGLDLME